MYSLLKMWIFHCHVSLPEFITIPFHKAGYFFGVFGGIGAGSNQLGLADASMVTAFSAGWFIRMGMTGMMYHVDVYM